MSIPIFFKKTFTIILLFTITASRSIAQYYFPPINSDEWETMSPEDLNWDQATLDSLKTFLDANDTKAFIVLKNGKLLVEEYFGTFEQDSSWYWASAGKVLTAFTVGLAQEAGHLNIEDTTSDYLGQGWTSLSSDQEKAITIFHQLTMTTGLNDTGDLTCTNPNCLVYHSPAGERWSYHNAPYTLLQEVVSNALPFQNFNLFFSLNLRNKIGMRGGFLPLDFNRVYFSDARSMARFGLLTLSGGVWDDEIIMADTNYFNAMIRPSNNINPSYGYLWWLNGQESFMLPGFQVSFPGPISPNAPLDMVSAIGKNSQLLCVVPSEDLVLLRLGDPPTDFPGLTGPQFLNEIWNYMTRVIDIQTSSPPAVSLETSWIIYPNPAQDFIYINGDNHGVNIYDMNGVLVKSEKSLNSERIDISMLSPGSYLVKCMLSGRQSIVIKK